MSAYQVEQVPPRRVRYDIGERYLPRSMRPFSEKQNVQGLLMFDSRKPSRFSGAPAIGWPVLSLALIGLAVLGAALYLRYEIIENTPLGLACEAGRQSLVCTVRDAVIVLFNQNAFGWTALIVAVIQFWRPNMVMLGVGLAASLAGLVLYNTNASALALVLLVLSLARLSPGASSAPSR
jgi:hypothetical protein